MKARSDILGFSTSNDKDWENQIIEETRVEIRKYYEKRLLSQMNLSKVTSSKISDMPVNRSNEFHSDTEEAFFKKVEALEWLDRFHKKLNMLPQEYREFIEVKYLSEPHLKNGIPDKVAIDKLFMYRTYYYEIKPKALYLFGLSLKNV